MARSCDRGPVDRALPPRRSAVLTILRLGANQILRLRVPDRAAVSESVELAREVAPRATGLVNAVLRRLAREGAPPETDAQKDPIAWLTTVGSLPRWLAERWVARLGPATARARATALLETPPVVFRVNPRVRDVEARLAAEGIVAEPMRVPGSWRLREGSLAGLAAEGIVYVQDQGSQIIAPCVQAERSTSSWRTRRQPRCRGPRRGAVRGGYLARLATPRSRGPMGRERARCRRRPAAAGPSVQAVLLDAPAAAWHPGRHPDTPGARRSGRHARRQRSCSGRPTPAAAAAPSSTRCSLEPERRRGRGPFLEPGVHVATSRLGGRAAGRRFPRPP
jgi:hypothetical protein